MEALDTLYKRIQEFGDMPAVYSGGETLTYSQFVDEIEVWRKSLRRDNVAPGTVCAIYGDFSKDTCALMFAMMMERIILVPLTTSVEKEMEGLKSIAGVQAMYDLREPKQIKFTSYDSVPQNDLVEEFRKKNRAGLIVFSSGSTGKPKGILQDCDNVAKKFIEKRRGWKTVLFLMMDHFGGFNTYLSTFAYGGTAVCLKSRSPEDVLFAIQDSGATLLPTTPTFINLMLVSGLYRHFNLSSVEIITYGTEVMPEATLKKVKEIFPNAQIKQTYGLSELGVLRSKSESDSSLWIKVGGDGFQVKVVDNILWIKSEANMVGYLNAPQPFDEEGWMSTGDEVEVQGEYIRIIGRKSEMINVGGQKVFPAEVESVLLEAENIKQATVYGVKHPLMGNVVNARVSLYESETPEQLSMRLRKYCLERLAQFKVPVRFIIVEEENQRNERFKKVRKIEEAG
ncbi:putative AMP-dependent synthetase and ligase [Leptospira ryugenii]|uniref:Putative AMP-dependent synthetase and ligase n=1 Tax=Leptospira ryugenii TaxID=1917863 RepID=A0A2P2DW70_9LEPT|nr:fatty acid--CoA ligase family protein [Leptospira ryugenii]GBF48847.1 putative AMP-dependent synthetase and ligase [Leptospira ryugenii]